MAYAWNGESEGDFDIYVRMVAGGAPLRLTTHPAHDYSPAWSPDGAQIAFLRRTGPAAAAVFLVPALGGAERKIAEFRASEWAPWSRPGSSLTWSPDGKWLVTPGTQTHTGSEVLLRVSRATGETLSWGRSELCLLPVSEALRPTGEVRILKTGSTWNTSPAWLPGGRTVVFSTGSMDAPHLARIDAAGSAAAERVLGAGEYGWAPSLARTADGRVRLVYTQHFESVNIWRTALDGSGSPVRLIASAHWSYEPAWSPDGDRIAFLSDRTGYGEIWVAGADGRNAQQWTFLKHPRLGAPRWSPDGRRLAFTAPAARGSSIYLIGAPGAEPRPVPGSEESGYLEWAHDGRAIYFSSNRGSSVEIWRVAVEGGTAVRVTDSGGRVPAISSDGRYLYYLKLASGDGRNDLWRRPLGNGAEEKVLDFVDAYSVGDNGIAFKYYSPGPQPVGPYLEFVRFPAGGAERLPDPQRPLRYGIALSRDGRYLLHAQADYQVGDIMLVEDFR
ncbi:MAG: hypothetical protein LAQ30_32125 [Acidobacteriia bacterium]|nr:hypothetical protein [Terriglobia bacterium]